MRNVWFSQTERRLAVIDEKIKKKKNETVVVQFCLSRSSRGCDFV